MTHVCLIDRDNFCVLHYRLACRSTRKSGKRLLVINNSLIRVLTLLCVLSIPTPLRAQNAPTAMTLVVDETQAARRIAFVHEEITVLPGPLALAYPKWIPGEHGPTGPLQQVAVIHVRTTQAGQATLPWVRDPDDISTIHVDVPAGTTRITVDFDLLLENTVSDHQVLLAWNTVILYPRAVDKRALMIEPSVLLPRGWKHGNSLRVSSQSGDRVNFAAVSLERLIDSPVLAGEFFRMTDAGLSKVDQLEEFGQPLLAHEQSHSWIGKYRRALEMYSKTDYQGPERTSLLWVYEGLNQYAGTLLATRAGFNDAEYARDS